VRQKKKLSYYEPAALSFRPYSVHSPKLAISKSRFVLPRLLHASLRQ